MVIIAKIRIRINPKNLSLHYTRLSPINNEIIFYIIFIFYIYINIFKTIYSLIYDNHDTLLYKSKLAELSKL